MFIRQWTARSHAWSADPDTFNGICGEEGEIPRLQRIVICEFCWPTLRLRLACQRRIVHLWFSHSCTAKCCPTVTYFFFFLAFLGLSLVHYDYIRHPLVHVYVFCFYLGHSSHFPLCFGAGVTNLNEPPSSCLLPPRLCGLGAGSIPLRAIVNKKQSEMRALFMSLVIHFWIGDVQESRLWKFQKCKAQCIALLCWKCR